MNSNEEIVGEAVRIEYNEKDGELFVVFKITSENYKKKIKDNWIDNSIEYKIINKNLVFEKEK